MLYHGMSPVFVFDGATPTLKRHTVASRRQFHVDKALQMRRTVEKLLLSSVKATLLHDEVVSKSVHDMGQGLRLDRHLKHVHVSQPGVDDDETAQPDGIAYHLEPHSRRADGERFYNRNPSANPKQGLCENVETEIPVLDAIDPEMLAKLPASMQFDLMLKIREQRGLENRRNLKKLCANTTDFSELQLSTYLKSSCLKEKIEVARKGFHARSSCWREAGGSDLAVRASSQVANIYNDDFKASPRVTSSRHCAFLLSKPKSSVMKDGVSHCSSTQDLTRPSQGTPISLQHSLRSVHHKGSQFCFKGPPVTMKTPPNAKLVTNISHASRTANTTRNTTDEQEMLLKQDDHEGIVAPDLTVTFKAENAAAEGIDPIFAKESHDPLPITWNSISNGNLDDVGVWKSMEVDNAIGHIDHKQKRNIQVFEETTSRNEEATTDFSCTDMREFQDKINRNSDTFLYAGAAHEQDREADDVSRHTGHNHTSKKETAWSPPMRECSTSDQPTNFAAQEQANLENDRRESDLKCPPHEVPHKVHRRQDDITNTSVTINAENAFNSEQMSESAETGLLSVTFKHVMPSPDLVEDDAVSVFLHFPNCVKPITFRSLYLFETRAHCALEKCPSNPSLDCTLGKECITLECRSFHVDVRPSTKNRLPVILLALKRMFCTMLSREGEMPNSNINPCFHFAVDAMSDVKSENHRQKLETMLDEARKEHALLQSEGKNAARGADTPTEEMYHQIQDLLTLFGVPYVIAPQEAEAQCAWMNSEGLVDAVITEDSDAFLFGASTVYRNVFNTKKYVEVYSVENIQRDIGLKRAQMAELALLLGSDYTEGIPGVGIVNALEIASVFSGMDGLTTFRNWVENGDLPDQVNRGNRCLAGSSLPKKHVVAKDGEGGHSVSDKEKNIDLKEGEVANIYLQREIFKQKHQAARTRWILPNDFPSVAVIEAYAKPLVDSSKVHLEWGKPNFELLRVFCLESFNWGIGKTDELLEPVIQTWERAERQTVIKDFFSVSTEQINFAVPVARFRSARIQNAITGLKFTSMD